MHIKINQVKFTLSCQNAFKVFNTKTHYFCLQLVCTLAVIPVKQIQNIEGTVHG